MTCTFGVCRASVRGHKARVHVVAGSMQAGTVKGTGGGCSTHVRKVQLCGPGQCTGWTTAGSFAGQVTAARDPVCCCASPLQEGAAPPLLFHESHHSLNALPAIASFEICPQMGRASAAQGTGLCCAPLSTLPGELQLCAALQMGRACAAQGMGVCNAPLGTAHGLMWSAWPLTHARGTGCWWLACV